MNPIEPPQSTTPDQDLLEIHRVVLREPPDPGEGRERGPWWLWVAVVFAIFTGGFYLGRYSGNFFENAVHVGYIRPRMRTMDPTGPGGLAPIAKEPLEKIGSRVFSTNCIACHQSSGQGVTGNFPPLAGSNWVHKDPEVVIRIVLKGLEGPVNVSGANYNGTMPAWGPLLSDEQIAGVVTYIRSSWGNNAPPVGVEDVARTRETYKDRLRPWTADELKVSP